MSPPDAMRTAFRPAPHGAVVGYRVVRSLPGGPARHLTLPTGLVSLVIAVPHPAPDGSAALPAPPLLSGVRRRAAITVSAGPATGIEVMLKPTAGYSLLGSSLHELVDRQVELLDPALLDTDRLTMTLGQLDCWKDRFALLDRFLSERIAAGPPASPGVVRAVLALRHGGGRRSVAELAADSRQSPRHLERLFKEQVGVSPKTYAQITRFRHALRLIGTGLSHADAAARAGFHDQAHLHRDFKSMTGRTPRQFLECTRAEDIR
ncbi:helix-turn-helix domain-containing protein [Streptomyces sp. NPDC007172]|uniref:AraC family transcriptional regulator n=1 Tax=Streptomyces sp. NPDC007172 TaxID=3364776 RepID=UPI0036A7452F